jgi:hypothetical protein
MRQGRFHLNKVSLKRQQPNNCLSHGRLRTRYPESDLHPSTCRAAKPSTRSPCPQAP